MKGWQVYGYVKSKSSVTGFNDGAGSRAIIRYHADRPCAERDAQNIVELNYAMASELREAEFDTDLVNICRCVTVMLTQERNESHGKYASMVNG